MADDKKVRWYSVQRNYDFETHDKDKNVVDPISEDDWVQRVKNEMHELYENGVLKSYAMIFHDKDMLETGFKPIHMHAVVEFKTTRRKANAINILKASSEQNVDYIETKGSKAAASRYLLHITEKSIRDGKNIYGEHELITEGGFDYHKMVASVDKTKTFLTFNDVKNAGLTVSLAIQKDGLPVEDAYEELRKYISDELILLDTWQAWKKRFDMSAERYKETLEQNYSLYGRRLTNLFISGAGATGKSTMARMLAVKLGNGGAPYKATVAGKDKTFDFVDGYKCQKVTILDDAKGSQFDMEEYLQVFDPYIYSPVSSRNNNKPWLSEYGILTTSETIEAFNEAIMKYSKGGRQFEATGGNIWKDHLCFNTNNNTVDRYKQVARRMKFVVEIQDKQATLKKFDETTLKYDAVLNDLPWDVETDKGKLLLEDTIEKLVSEMQK